MLLSGYFDLVNPIEQCIIIGFARNGMLMLSNKGRKKYNQQYWWDQPNHMTTNNIKKQETHYHIGNTLIHRHGNGLFTPYQHKQIYDIEIITTWNNRNDITRHGKSYKRRKIYHISFIPIVQDPTWLGGNIWTHCCLHKTPERGNPQNKSDSGWVIDKSPNKCNNGHSCYNNNRIPVY